MPKQKTKKSIVKRVKITGTGKVRRHKPGIGHLKSRKSPKVLRGLRKEQEVNATFSKHIKQMLGQ